jgi:hypothetical protein
MLLAARPRKWGRKQIVTSRRKLYILALIVIFGLSLEPALETLLLWSDHRGESLLRVDYSLYVLSALQGMHQGWHHLYDLEAQRRTWQELPSVWWFPNVYTPALSVVMIPFTHLSRDAGYALWSAILFACMLVSWHFSCPTRCTWGSGWDRSSLCSWQRWGSATSFCAAGTSGPRPCR